MVLDVNKKLSHTQKHQNECARTAHYILQHETQTMYLQLLVKRLQGPNKYAIFVNTLLGISTLACVSKNAMNKKYGHNIKTIPDGIESAVTKTNKKERERETHGASV